MFYKYNASTEKCPLPLVNLRVLLKKMSDADSCLITIADKGSKQDIPKYLVKQDYHFTQTVSQEGLVDILINPKDY
ncbi:MAG: sulfurtransferase TusA family protein [Thalassotalea sp.]